MTPANQNDLPNDNMQRRYAPPLMQNAIRP